MQGMSNNESMTDKPLSAFSVASIGGSCEKLYFVKQFFVFIKIHLFTELPVFQGSITSFERHNWNMKTFNTVRKCNNLGSDYTGNHRRTLVQASVL